MSQGDEIEELFEVPLDEFVTKRNAIAKALTDRGDKAAAKDVKALVKPSAPAWALNQLARHHKEEVETFLKASDRLARAQLRSLGRTGDADYSEAAKEQRRTLDALLDVADSVLETAGHKTTRPLRERMARTLRAIALDEPQRTLFERGRLVADLEDVGFDALATQLGGSLDALPALPEAPARKPKEAPRAVPGKTPPTARTLPTLKVVPAAKKKAEAKVEIDHSAERKTLERAEAEAERALEKAEKLRAEADAKLMEARRVRDEAKSAVEDARHQVIVTERTLAKKEELVLKEKAAVGDAAKDVDEAKEALRSSNRARSRFSTRHPIA